jgi:protoheme IX farnesyltransferase
MSSPLRSSTATETMDGAYAQRQATSGTLFRDLVALTKPRITALVITTTTGGIFLAPARCTAITIACTLIGTVLIVGGANALNMYIERNIDRRMVRTQNRPLPAGRMAPAVALWFGIGLSVASLPILFLGVNATTALLAALANLLYVLAYTPMKQRSHFALLVGAVPGAIPPLLGWTAATNRVDTAGLVLFGVLFLWQIPHFLAITLFRAADYARAGLQVAPNVVGERATRHDIVRYTMSLVACTLLLVPLRVAGSVYFVGAALLDAVFLGWACYGLRSPASTRWAKSLFGVSILYLFLLFAVLFVDRMIAA